MSNRDRDRDRDRDRPRDDPQPTRRRHPLVLPHGTGVRHIRHRGITFSHDDQHVTTHGPGTPDDARTVSRLLHDMSTPDRPDHPDSDSD